MPTRKYANLRNKLRELKIRLEAEKTYAYRASFKEVETWAGAPLPPSAYKHRPWWSNNEHNTTNADRPWEQVGLATEDVDMDGQTVVFRVTRLTPPPPDPSQPPSFRRFLNRPPADSHTQSARGLSDVAQPFTPQRVESTHPLRGALKGAIRITVDVDLTAPADPEWADRP